MTVMVTTLTFTVIKPALERNRGFNVINEASVNLELLSSAINEVASEAEGSKRTVTLSVSDGEYLIDKNSNSIIFTFEPSVDLGVIGRIADKFLEKGLAFFDFFNNYLDNSLPNNLINVSGNWRVYNNRVEGINGTAYYFIDKNLNGFYVASNFGSDNNLGQIFVSSVNLSGLVLYLTFDEGSGNIVYDYSGNKNNGILYNDPVWVDGKFGKALSFDGVDDYVEIPLTDSLKVRSVTIEAWVYLRKEPPAYSYGLVGSFGVSKYYLEYYPHEPAMWIRVGGTDYGISFYESIVGKWSHLVGVYTSGRFELWINGVRRALRTDVIGDLEPIAQPINVGRNFSATAGFLGCPDGIIDEVRIYNRALSNEEIRFLYQEGLKKLQNSGMLQFNSKIKPYIAISNPSGKIYVENLRIGNQNSKEIKLIKPFYNLEFDSSFRFSKGNHQIKIENIGFNYTSKRPIIRISES
jgi:hypothetical protein